MTILLADGTLLEIEGAISCRTEEGHVALIDSHGNVVQRIPKTNVMLYGRREVLITLLERASSDETVTRRRGRRPRTSRSSRSRASANQVGHAQE